jgi:hypothetical protein
LTAFKLAQRVGNSEAVKYKTLTDARKLHLDFPYTNLLTPPNQQEYTELQNVYEKADFNQLGVTELRVFI